MPKPIPTPKKRPKEIGMFVRMSPATRLRVRIAAAKCNVSTAEWIRRTLDAASLTTAGADQ